MDDVPDLVSSSSSSIRSSESSSEYSNDEEVESFLKLACHIEDGSWRLFTEAADSQLDLIIQIELIAPFIFRKNYTINILNEWLKNSNLSFVLVSSSNCEWHAEEKRWSYACLFIELYTRMSECNPINLKEYIKKNHNVFMQLNSMGRLEDALNFLLGIEWFQKIRNSKKIDKRLDILTPMLIISFYVSRTIIDKRDVVNEFINYVKKDEKESSALLKPASDYFNQHHYEEALDSYNQYILAHPFNYKVYSQRAQAHIKLNNKYLADFDKKRSSILQAVFSQPYEKIDDLDLSVPLCPYKDENDNSNSNFSKNVIAQYGCHHKSQIAVNNSERQDVNNSIPELVSSSESNDDNDKEEEAAEKITDSVLTSKNEMSIVVTTATTTTVTMAEASTTIASSMVSDIVAATSSISPSKKNLCSLKENICNASHAFLNKQADKAVNLFAKAVKALSQLKDEFETIDIVLLNYAWGCSCAAIGTFENLIQAISIFEEICKQYPSATFPLIYYQMGHCYYKLNRFKQALEPLKKGFAQLNHLSSIPNYCWPETSVALDDNPPEKLKLAMEELELLCQNPPLPDVFCRYDKCGEFKKEIYFSDPDLKGFVIMKCKERCALNYHLNCWRALKDGLHKTNDKEFLGSVCVTPDCQSLVREIVYLDNKGDITKQFVLTVKETLPLKPKPKKLRLEKKKLKTRKKKAIPTTVSTETQQLLPEIICGNEEEEPEDKSTAPTKISVVLPKCSALIDSSQVKVIKKHEDELESVQAKCVRQRDKKKEKKKPIKMMSLDEFLGDRTNEPQLLYNEYVQRLMKLQEYRNEIEIGENSVGKPELSPISTNFFLGASDLQSFMSSTETSSQLLKENIILHFEKILERIGPIHLKDPLVMEEMCKMSLECQDLILSSGGLLNIFKDSERFLVKDNFLCLAEMAGVSKYDESELYLVKKNKLDSLDSFDLVACGGDFDNKVEINPHTTCDVEDILRNFDSEPSNSLSDGMPLTGNSNSESHDKASSIENNFCFNGSAESLPQCIPLSARPTFSDSGKSESDSLTEENKIYNQCRSDFSTNSRKKLSQSRILQKVLQFLPLFSKESKTKLLCSILKTIVNEKTLLQYKENYAQNIDVQGLEKYFIYAADVLKRASNKKTQTEFPLFDFKMKDEIESLRKENVFITTKLAEYKLMESRMNAMQQEMTNLQVQLQQRTLLLQKRESQLQSLYQMTQTAQKQNEKEKELKMKIEKLEEELKLCKNKNGEMQQKMKLETGSDTKLQDASATISSIPAVNSFEKLIQKLHSRFPSFSREKLKVYVQQLRSRHRNHLTGLTLEQITYEVSAMISNEIAGKGAVPRNALGKHFSSAAAVPLSSLDDISEYDNAWTPPSSLAFKWNYDEDNNDDMCLICHEDMIKENSLKLQCSHLFHSKCIREWFRQQSTCPVCRVHSLLPDEFPSLT